MCFSVNVNIVKEELESRYGATLIDPDKYRPSYYYHAFSLPELPALCTGIPGKFRLLKWGLIPSWVNNNTDAENIRFKTFNARSESIDKKPSFSSSFTSKRCLIPVRGFFEWQHIGSKKRPWYIYRYDNEIFSLAGLYDEWHESLTGDIISTFSIVTTTANEIMSEIHNSGRRMPVILDENDEMNWIDPSFPVAELHNLLKPASSEILKAHTISSLVNSRSVDRNTPDVIKPFDYQPDNLLF